MAGRQYSVEDVLAYMEIPLPEDDDDDLSGDEFDGYISEDDDRVQGGDGYESGVKMEVEMWLVRLAGVMQLVREMMSRSLRTNNSSAARRT